MHELRAYAEQVYLEFLFEGEKGDRVSRKISNVGEKYRIPQTPLP